MHSNKHPTKQTGVVLALMGLVGCSSSRDIPENQPVQMSARLEAFESCEGLESYIENAAVLDMRASLERSKPSYWRSWGGGVVFSDGAAPPSAPNSDSGGGASPGSYTGTNNQVAGVDEADFVKNDGTRLFVLSGQKLYLHRSWPAESLRTESSLTIEGRPRQMFLHGDKVVVFSEVYSNTNPSGAGGASDSTVGCNYLSICVAGGIVSTKVTTVDVSQLAAPQVTGELYLPGGYHDARLSGGSVRLVLNEFFVWPAGMRWYPEYNAELWADTSRLEREIDALKDANEQLIRARSLSDWRRDGYFKQPDGTQVPVAQDCRDFHKTNAPTQLGYVTVASIDLNAAVAQAPGRTTLVAQPDILYANGDALYLTARHWWWWWTPGQRDYTYIHKLDLEQPGRVRYVASGTLEGHLLDQFSLDEHEGVLRTATTISWRVDEAGNPWGRTETTNRVSTLRQEGNRLKSLGRSEDLAKGERIFSARFLGNKGYVVTFRQVDPLFTFDLSDPAHPRKVGELKVPGFSTYIHPLGDTHLLTLGVQVAENGDWRSRSLKLSLFDVSDLAHPREAFTQLVGSPSSGSEALYDHKAFNFFAAKGLLAIPFTDWAPSSTGYYWDNFVSDLRVFRVDTATGFTPLGALSMSDVYRTLSTNRWNYWYQPYVRRSVMADDYVYAISDGGVRVSHVNQLSTPLATERFQPTVVY
ncbi:hypothetical protein CYFUS_000559 [Cystobacter fuscus]|uniref:Lipoprotein n=1 Tax=Cystobacter fuscus TaxID=43 RepID=A0A250IVC0_9BACT|nr:beta-propeller domain-containing protein [Cystobacter fuscus]ATB35147.1 hypothetical protein CYFUS_000559 [Cystobacter fuscus]